YRVEWWTFDGREPTFPFIPPGVRSPLGNFLYSQDEIVKEGLFGGVLSTGWLFNYPDEKKGTLSVQGTKKLDGREVQILTYTTKSGSGLGIHMFFEAATARPL